MNTAVMAVGALALAGISFGAGRLTASANATASATATPAAVTCTNNDSLADMIKDRAAKHEAAVERENQRAKAPIKAPDFDGSTAH